jgi:hypothetical protein
VGLGLGVFGEDLKPIWLLKSESKDSSRFIGVGSFFGEMNVGLRGWGGFEGLVDFDGLDLLRLDSRGVLLGEWCLGYSM